MADEQKPLRLLTAKEAMTIFREYKRLHGRETWAEWKLFNSLQRKFCEVNGLPEPQYVSGVDLPDGGQR